jgi:hypothetical protein
MKSTMSVTVVKASRIKKTKPEDLGKELDRMLERDAFTFYLLSKL